MDTYIIVVCHWRSMVFKKYVKAQVAGAFVGIGDFSIYVNHSIDAGDGG